MASNSITLPKVVSSVDATAPVVSSGGISPTISIPQANGSTDGYLSSADFTTFNSKQNVLTLGNLTDIGTDGITITGGTGAIIGSGTTLSQHVSDSTHNGYLNSTDWSTFNNKVNDAQIYYHFSVSNSVVENDVVMNSTNPNNGQAPLQFVPATNGDQQYYPQIYGIAKNVSGGFADIYLGTGSVVSGFNFGVFIGVEYYIDPATPGKLTWTPPSGTLNAIKVGRALSASQLILEVYSQFVQDKGALYTSDGSGYDSTLLVGSNGQVLVANSAAANGINWAAGLVAATPFTYTSSTRTLTIATATGSVAGVLSAADWTTFNNKAATASPTFTGTPTLPTGTIGVTQSAGDSSTKLATTSFVTTADNLKANLASPTFTGTPTLPTGTIGVTQAAANSTTALATTAFVTTADNLKANLASPTFTGDINSSTGNVLVSTIGKGLQVKTGTNAKVGTAVLVGGTKTVANTSVTANSLILLTSNVDGGTVGFLRVSAKTAATSFVITSSSVLDTSTVVWMIVESIP